jgi:hypothetical protein
MTIVEIYVEGVLQAARARQQAMEIKRIAQRRKARRLTRIARKARQALSPKQTEWAVREALLSVLDELKTYAQRSHP